MRYNRNVVESGVKHHKPTKPTNQLLWKDKINTEINASVELLA